MNLLKLKSEYSLGYENKNNKKGAKKREGDREKERKREKREREIIQKTRKKKDEE